MKIARPYQLEAIESARRDLESKPSTLIVLPTGMGKTYVAAQLMTGWTRGNSLFLAHTKELIEQNAAALAAEMDGYKPIIEMNVQGASAYDAQQSGLCVVGSIQTMYTDRRLDKYGHNPFGLIVVDEAHRGTAATYRKVIDYFRSLNPDLKVVGLTATPTRADETSLGVVFDSVAKQMSISQSIEEGWLTPLSQKAIVIDGVDFSEVRCRKNEFNERDFSDASLEKILADEERLQGLRAPIMDAAGSRSTLVFMPGVKSAHLMASIINRFKPDSAAAIDGETPKDKREQIVKDFRAGRLQYLCNCLVLTEGFDAPECSCLAMCRPTKSLGRYVQMLGRALRPLPGTVDGIDAADGRREAIAKSRKADALILDFAGLSEHKLVDVWDALAGNTDPEAVALAESEGEKRNISEDIDKAKLLRQMMLAWEERRRIKASNVDYRAYEVDPFGGPNVARSREPRERGSISDKQLALLCNLGVNVETARAYSKRQAGAVIDSLASKRCTIKQAKVLNKYGIPTDGVGMDKASEIIDAIACNNWWPLNPEQLAAVLTETE